MANTPRRNEQRTESQDDKRGRRRIPPSLWTHRDQDQNNHHLPHCCGECGNSSGGNEHGLL